MSVLTKIGRVPGMTMKHVTRLALLTLAVVAIAACGGEDVQAVPSATPQPAATDVPSPPVPAATATPLPPTPTPAQTATATPEPTVEPTAAGPDLSRFADVPEIVDPTNFGWPRSIETAEGVIVIKAPPEKVHSLSLGHSEILVALMDFDRLTAVYSFFVDEEQSNIAELSAAGNMIGFDPEEVVALEPEVIIASRFTNADTVALLNGAGLPVARTALENSALGNVPNILLIGYIIGAEAEALALAEDIESRMQVITDNLPGGEKPRVLSVSKWTSAFAAGSESTEGGIIEQAGGINAAADSGIDGHQQVSIESIAAINPDVILVPQPLEGANLFIDELMSSAALAEVPAIKNGRVHYVLPRYHTTLSHWNVRGIEQLAKLLFPAEFADVTFADFAEWPDYGDEGGR
jgi:iron complex transport system substrate-binding protein